MTMTIHVRWASSAVAAALLGLAWGGGDAMAASPPIEGAPQAPAIVLDPGEADLLTSTETSRGLCPIPGERESVDSAGKEIQVAGPVRRQNRRVSRRTARRTSRRQEVLYD